MEPTPIKLSLLFSILAQKRFFVTALIGGLAYFIIYLAAIQNLIVSVHTGEEKSFFEFMILPNWQDLIFRERAPFLFEPIGAFYLGNIRLFLSVPNILLATLLGLLVAFNLALSYYSLRLLRLRGVRGFTSLLSTIPAIFSGMACCVPTIILVIGLQLTATLVTLWSFLIPLSIILLLVSIWWSLHKIQVKNCRQASGKRNQNDSAVELVISSGHQSNSKLTTITPTSQRD